MLMLTLICDGCGKDIDARDLEIVDPEGRPACLKCETCRSKPTVKKLDIFGNVIDTFQTEGELNGWRPTQGSLF